tara:strand:- start:7537 stop:8547 length:1011 start_codon:yes stop_codon:yes gene_type:complete
MKFNFLLLLILSFLSTVKSLRIPISNSYSKKKPNNVKIFDKDLVVWWDNHKWCATNDMCLHRQGSLSKGVITKEGKIKCGYHGWEYNECGKCTHFPSTNKKLNIENGFYNIEEKDNVLWYIDDNCHNNDPVFENTFKNYIFTRWTYEELNGSHDLYLENIMDLLHFNHVHHNTPPPVSRYKEMDIISKNESIVHWFNESGFSLEVIGNTPSSYVFVAPYSLLFTLGDNVNICSFIYPIDKDHCTFYTSLLLHKQNNKIKNAFLKHSYQFIKPAIDFYGKGIFAQDKEQIIEQHKNIQKHGKKYISPYVSDKPILLYNQWMNTYYNRSTVFNIDFNP